MYSIGTKNENRLIDTSSVETAKKEIRKLKRESKILTDLVFVNRIAQQSHNLCNKKRQLGRLLFVPKGLSEELQGGLGRILLSHSFHAYSPSR